ncbi:DUF7576 family protein [Halorussus caseinilyticus]|uniref:DUF3330 domain-containing protein n=1 Tax=Halorussus caseinilyticus TaxID=3034025 RepID=A0ABD5WS50_9EURY|nr:hypothetical protein [Halorussus sp. DT72]
MSDGQTTFPRQCDHCGTPFETNVRYPTATEDGECDSLEIHTFCDEECKSAWQRIAESADS